MKNFVFCIIAVFMLSSCSDTPQNLKTKPPSNIKLYPNGKIITEVVTPEKLMMWTIATNDESLNIDRWIKKNFNDTWILESEEKNLANDILYHYIFKEKDCTSPCNLLFISIINKSDDPGFDKTVGYAYVYPLPL